jgi:hypothetical protein
MIDLDSRPMFRERHHVRPMTFLGIAFEAGQHQVRSVVRTASRSGYDVIDRGIGRSLEPLRLRYRHRPIAVGAQPALVEIEPPQESPFADLRLPVLAAHDRHRHRAFCIFS